METANENMFVVLYILATFSSYACGEIVEPENITLISSSDTYVVDRFPWVASNTLFFTLKGSGDFCLVWPDMMTLRFNEKVVFYKGQEGVGGSGVLAEYTRENLYTPHEEKTYWFTWGGGFALFGEGAIFGQDAVFHRRIDTYDSKIATFSVLHVRRTTNVMSANVNISIFKPFAVPFITHWYKLNDTERNVVEGSLLDSNPSSCVQVPDVNKMLGPFRMMFRVPKRTAGSPTTSLTVDLYGNDGVCSKRTQVFTETEERTDTLTAGKFLKCSRDSTVNQSGNLKVCHYECVCVVDCKYLQLTVDNSALGPELCEVVIADTTA